ncbi:hypothetical protein [Paenibacillus xylaniclasticus]|uniref:hypothetical protein n=1 Tax=Paenibacillus xylaniclasticus TaxID=588083 RepID=UPI000FDB4180|nr:MULTISPECIES: hypothetical protein [Paenibacillus]GFN32991.1 hypothetical protein PCURB6_32510 [Paenibacillus curdlanolyticus]
MNEWYTTYRLDMEIVFQSAFERIQCYPPLFREQAEAYIHKFNPLVKESTNNYICYLLPFWVKDAAGIGQHTSRELSIANVFVMLYFFIQDDLMDSHQKDWKNKLALGNLFQTTYLDLYRRLFTSESSFWRYYRQYVEEWSIRVTSASTYNLFEHAPASLAGKASPVKLASTGAMLLGDKEPLVEEASHLIDHVLATLQMVDDWIDWEEDLLEGSDNSFVDFIRLQQQLQITDTVTAELMNRWIFTTDALARFTRYAADRHRLITSYSVPYKHLLDFHKSLIQQLEEAYRHIAATKSSMLRGGLIHYLSSVMK